MASDESSPWMNSFDHFPPDFQNYLKEEKYLCKKGDYHSQIFLAGGQLLAIDWAIEGKIREVIKKYDKIGPWTTLLQFWKAVKMREDQYLLTTRQQPFSICGEHCKGLYGYRQACRNYEYYVDNEAEEEGKLGIPGRVFKYKSSEFTPNVIHYTIQEYPHLDEARYYSIKQIFAFPVFEVSNKQCVGVFELITTQYELLGGWDCFFAEDFEHIFKDLGLGLPDRHASSHQGVISLDTKYVIELKNALSKICENPAVRVAQAWEPCNDYQPHFNRDIASISHLGLLLSIFNKDLHGDLEGLDDLFLVDHIREGQGVAGMAFSSCKLALCSEISQTSIIDHPLKPYAVEIGCKGIFAIRLQCNHTGNGVLVLEFFFSYDGDVYTQLYQILKEMKKHLSSFRDFFGQELGEELPILLIHSQTNRRHNFMPIPGEREQVQHSSLDATITRRNDVILGQRNTLIPCSPLVGETMVAMRQCRKSGIPISLEDIKQQIGKRLNDAAESIGVSRSTFKRACREYGILWWQSRKGKKDSPPTFCGVSVQKVTQGHVPDFTMSTNSKQPHEPPMTSNTFRMQHSMPLEIVNNVDVKLVYDTVCGNKFAMRFQLSLSSGVEELRQEVIRRLNWVNFETYSIHYIDEDNDWILISCDDDLRRYMSSTTSSGKTTITFYLIPLYTSA